MRALLLAALFAATTAAAQQVDIDDSRADYYYPPVSSSERFQRVLTAPPRTQRADRIGFVDSLTRQQLDAPYAPRYALFAKGSNAEHLIAVALDDAVFATLFRARAVMAQLSAPARATKFIVDQRLDDRATFYDMARLLGFETLTISDGRSWTHRVEFR